jgi:hypothetical protein
MNPCPILAPHMRYPRPLTQATIRALWRLGGYGLVLAQTGCSILSYSPTLELVKAAGIAANGVASVAPSSARDVVQHPHGPVLTVCIAYNRSSPAADVVPALQVELQSLGVESRVYEATASPANCRVWLNYSAFIEWDVPTFGDRPEPYLSSASLTLRNDGQVLASAAYEFDGMGKWASTRKKLAPLVKAVVEDPQTNSPRWW